MNNKKYKGVYYPVRDVTDLKDIIVQSTRMFPEHPAYLVKDRKLGKFVPITYGKVKEDLDGFGTKLIDMGLKGRKIAVIGETSYYWILTYFTVVAGVGAIVPLDKNLPQDELMGLVERSGASAIVYSDKSEKSIRPLFDDPFDIEFFISIDGNEDTDRVLSMNKLIRQGRELLESGDRRYVSADIDPDQMATLMFTSGTTGLAKGVMLSQRNIAANVQNMSMMFEIPEPGIVLSILPVHHAYEMTCDIWTTFYQGKTIAICEGLRYIQKNMAEVHANVMLGVPLVFEKMYKGMFKQAEARGEGDKLRNAIALSKRLKLYNNKPVVKRMFKAIHQSFGGDMQKFVAGGAAIDPKVIEDFEAMGFTMIQGYGMSENAPIIAVNQDRYSKAESVGLPMPHTEVRIINSDEDGVGEIICKGPSVMLGYYENPEATEEVLHNGWLHTGDLGYIDKDGFVYVTGRKKTVIVTKGGKNIFPEEVEAVLLEDELIQEVLVHGVTDERVGNVMITADIYPNYKLLKEQKGEMNSSEIYHFYKDLVDEINKKMPAYKQVKRINIRTEEFAKTTTGKIKRFGNTLITNAADSRGRASFSEIRRAQMKRAKKKAQALADSTDPYVVYKTSRPITDIKQMIETSTDIYGDRVAFYQKYQKDMPYTVITYRQMLADVNGLGTALMNRGLSGARIAVMGKNCYQWGSSYLAVICGTGVVVPLDKELSEKEIGQLIEASEVSCVIFEDGYKDMFARLRRDPGNKLQTLISFGDADPEREVLSWKELIREGQKEVSQGDRQFLDAEITADDMAVILYTSGTTGVAKGVMLSHANICDNLMSAPTLLNVEPTDIFFSVLPIHHTYECTCGFLMPLYKGASVAYCQGLRYIEKNLKEVRPTMFLGVPVLIEGLYKKIWKEIRKQGKDKMFSNLLAVNRLTSKARLNLVKPFAGDILKVFGGNLRMIISGGAAIDPAVLEFFNTIGIQAVQGYGLTECSPMAALNPDDPARMKNDSVGHLLPGMDVKVIGRDEDGIGEIVLKGANVMLGYYNDPEATDEVLKDGWFSTGDLGYVDKDRFLYLTGRKKNVIITKNGKNVYPEELENYLNHSPYIAETMVWGCESEIDPDEMTVAATVTLEKDEVEAALGADYTPQQAQDLIWEEVDRINEDLPLFKKIKKVVVREDDFQKNTAQKIKRFVDENKEG